MERKIALAICLAVAVTLGGCAANPAPNGKKIGSDSVYNQSGMEISRVVSNMADTLYKTLYADLAEAARKEAYANNTLEKQIVFPKVAVTSFVDTDTYEDAGYLGRELGELFIHELDRRGIPVHEFKITGNISVTKTGELVFSRNWKKIAARAMVKHILAGTITRNSKGVVLVGRIINMADSSVVGSTTGFIPYADLPYCYRTGQKNCSLNGVVSYTSLDPSLSSDVKTTGGYAQTSASGVYSNSGTSSGSGSTRKPGQKTDAEIIHDSIHSDRRFNEKYYPDGARSGGTSTGNYEEYLYRSGTNTSTCRTSDCVNPVIYPADSYGYKGHTTRDVHDQSQYTRVSDR